MGAPHLTTGTVLLGRFRIEALIGEGGMGSVYLAWHLALEIPVAIKLLRWDVALGAEEQARARFAREARALARVRSEYVCRPLDFGELQSGEPYLVLEYLEGRSLARVAAPRALPLTTSIDIALQVAAGLAEAHRFDLVHRDIKPANVFLASAQGGRQVAKLVDFGLAKALGIDAAITRGDEIIGTPEYMSPEQIGAPESVDQRSDIWSLGALMFWMFFDESPFAPTTKLGLISAVLDGEPRKLTPLRPDLPPAITRAVDACLVRDPAARTQSVADLATQLEPFASPEGSYAAMLTRAKPRVDSRAPSSPWSPAEATVLNPTAPARTVEFRTPKKRRD